MIKQRRAWRRVVATIFMIALSGCSGAPAPENHTTPPAQTEPVATDPEEAAPVEPAPATPVAAGENSGPVPFTVRHASETTVTAGTINTVTVTMDYTGEEPVTALALQVKIPDGWQYAGVSGDLRPAIEPAAGAHGELAFIWINIPSFPATFSYDVDVPADAPRQALLSVKALYRGLGPQRTSPVSAVTLNLAP